MAVFVALYRGINVGGKNSVKMESLRALHEGLGHRGVKNYIQSGKYRLLGNGLGRRHRPQSRGCICRRVGFTAQVVVVDAARWKAILAANPYAPAAAEHPQTVFAAICEGEPNASSLQALLAKTGGRETFAIGPRIVYLHAPDGVGRSKFAAGMEKACGVPVTMRNWRTIEAIAELIV